MFKYRLINNEDYETLKKWWKDNRFPVLGLDDLPIVNGQLQGLIVSSGDTELCAGFIINTTVKNAAMIEYVVANYEIKDRSIRSKSQVFLLESLKEQAKQLGKKYVFTSVKKEGLISKFKESGFSNGSKNTTEMICFL